MDPLKLIQSHPLATEVVYEWFLEKVLESFTDEDETERYKQIMSIERDEQLSKLIADQPRLLFDVFDNHQIYIEIQLGMNHPITWFYGINRNMATNDVFGTRKQAELEAVSVAFNMLEVKLSPTNVNEIETVLNKEEYDNNL